MDKQMEKLFRNMAEQRRERDWEEFINEEILMSNAYPITRYELVDWLCEESIFPALKRAGFVLGITNDSYKRRMCHWWKMQCDDHLAGVDTYPVYTPPVKHNGTMADFQLFDEKLSAMSFWLTLGKQYAAYQFMDDTFVGRDIMYSLQWFTWVYLSLDDSPYFIRIREEEEEEEQARAEWEREHGKDAIRLLQEAEDRKRMGGGRRTWND